MTPRNLNLNWPTAALLVVVLLVGVYLFRPAVAERFLEVLQDLGRRGIDAIGGG